MEVGSGKGWIRKRYGRIEGQVTVSICVCLYPLHAQTANDHMTEYQPRRGGKISTTEKDDIENCQMLTHSKISMVGLAKIFIIGFRYFIAQKSLSSDWRQRSKYELGKSAEARIRSAEARIRTKI